MRNQSNIRKNSGAIPWKWIVVVIIIFTLLFVLRSLGGETDQNPWKWSLVNGSWTFVVTQADGTKKDVPVWESFYETDVLFSVISGSAILSNEWWKYWLDKNSDLSHSDTHSGGFFLSQWRMWIEASSDQDISLKHIHLKLDQNDIVLIEQQRIYSIAYVLQWEITVEGNGRNTALKSGKRIMVSQSNLINPGVTLESLIWDIDDSIQQNAFFLARNGKSLLENLNQNDGWSGSLGTINSISWSSGTITQWNGAKYIQISAPIDGSIVTGWSIVVEGKSLSPQVKKIVIDDQSLTLAQSPGTFRSAPITLTTSTIDIVYRAYDATNNLLERWVLTLYSDEKKSGTEKLIPKTFPTSDKDFRVISPNENPYKTTLSAVTVSGTVPKWAVEYITVNNFRLKKFVPASTNWYYYANVSYQTMKEWFNLYEIRFYWQNDTLLSTQLFTIIKEWWKTVSWEL